MATRDYVSGRYGVTRSRRECVDDAPIELRTWLSLTIELICLNSYLYTGCKEFQNGNIGMASMHKKQRRQDRDGLVMMAR